MLHAEAREGRGSALAALRAFAVGSMSEMTTPERYANHLAFLCMDLTDPEFHEHALAVHRAHGRVIETLVAERAVAALAADPDVMAKTGRALATWGLYEEYGFTDVDGTQPDFAAYWAEALEGEYGPLGDPL